MSQPAEAVGGGVRSLSLNTSDGQLLAADIADAVEPALGAVVICHPHPLYGGNRFNAVVEALFAALPPARFTAIRFDFRAVHDGGVGERLDVVAALDAVADAGGDVPLFVVGYSFGAIVALATNDRRVAGLVAVAPPLTLPLTLPLTGQSVAPTVPCLVLAPRHDQFCPVDTATAVVATWPNAELEVVESADHFLAGRTLVVTERSVAWLVSRLSSLPR